MELIDKLLYYWKFDEASGTIVDAHGSNDGTNNVATYWATGKINDALDFEQGDNDEVDIDDGTGHTEFSFIGKMAIDATRKLASENRRPTGTSVVPDYPSLELVRKNWKSYGLPD